MTVIYSKWRPIVDSILALIGTLGFAWFVSAPFPMVALAVVGLCLPAWVLVRQINKPSDVATVFGLTFNRKTWPFLVIGILSGILVSLLYRWHLGLQLLPQQITLFALVAASIGASEELFFRGFIQGNLAKTNSVLAVLGGSAAHTLYKTFLFLSPFAAGQVDIQFLAIYTFGFGLLFGFIKQISGSIIPALVAHALFDVWIYGQLSGAPWWVW